MKKGWSVSLYVFRRTIRRICDFPLKALVLTIILSILEGGEGREEEGVEEGGREVIHVEIQYWNPQFVSCC